MKINFNILKKINKLFDIERFDVKFVFEIH